MFESDPTHRKSTEDLAGDAGNRPAANARRSSTTEAMNHDFDGQMEAEDFLGLEGEVDALAGSFGEEPEASAPPEGDLGIAEGWLLELDEAGSGSVTGPASEVADEGAPEQAEFDAEGDWAAEGEGPFEEESFEEELPVAAPSHGRKLVLVGFLAGIGITAGLYFSDNAAPTNEGADSVARVEPAPSTTLTAPVPEPVNPIPEPDTTAVDTLLDDGTTADAWPDSGSTSVLDDLLAVDSGSPPAADRSSTGAPVGRPVIPDLEGLDPADLAIAQTPDAPRSFLRDLENGIAEGDVKGFMEFHPAHIGLIWTGMEVPFEAIAKPGRLLTPGVGVVRATMVSGEIFEGHLFAVGGQRVWIEIGAGRIGLDGERVSRIERLVEESASVATDDSALPGLRVRVRTAGGVLYGQVKSREGNRVTILTDKGGRISLVDPVIEPIGRVSELVLKP